HPPFRVLATVRIKSPVRIAVPASQGHIRYRFGFLDGIEFAPPETGEQRVTLNGAEATVDICDGCGPGLPTDPAYLADARRPTAWLQSAHPKIRAITNRTARLKVSDARKMELLSSEALGHLGKLDFTGHYSALETLERGAGDCTEAAVLLAAFGRAVGIPTRVVNGLVYSRERYHGVSNSFMPHSWVVAYVGGQWRSYDAALTAFDSTHIALTIGDGDARSVSAAGQLGSLLIWESMAEVRTR
ncbi:MAG: transglutaminase family protein, partial [Sphingomonas sp.]